MAYTLYIPLKDRCIHTSSTNGFSVVTSFVLIELSDLGCKLVLLGILCTLFMYKQIFDYADNLHITVKDVFPVLVIETSCSLALSRTASIRLYGLI